MAGVTASTRWAETRARHGLVAAPHGFASEARLAMPRRGGNVWLIYDAARGALRGAVGRAAADAYQRRLGSVGSTRLQPRRDRRARDSWGELLSHTA
jgi:hypothetical protein